MEQTKSKPVAEPPKPPASEDPLVKPPVRKPESKNSKGCLIACAVSCGTLLLIVIVLIILAIVWGNKLKNELGTNFTPTEFIQQLEEGVNSASNAQPANNLEYVNNEFGFKLKLTPSWKDYTTKREPILGDFGVMDIKFYLPSSLEESLDIPGYVNLFTISAYVKESWDDYIQTYGIEQTGMMGEEVGRNSQYVFVYSHFNGFPPSDISQKAITDMDIIAKGLQALKPTATVPGKENYAKPQSRAFNCSDWIHPNGDMEYWWWDASEDERQCYISKYGNPPINDRQ